VSATPKSKGNYQSHFKDSQRSFVCGTAKSLYSSNHVHIMVVTREMQFAQLKTLPDAAILSQKTQMTAI